MSGTLEEMNRLESNTLETSAPLLDTRMENSGCHSDSESSRRMYDSVTEELQYDTSVDQLTENTAPCTIGFDDHNAIVQTETCEKVDENNCPNLDIEDPSLDKLELGTDAKSNLCAGQSVGTGLMLQTTCQSTVEASSPEPSTTDCVPEENHTICSDKLATPDKISKLNDEKCDNCKTVSSGTVEENSVDCFAIGDNVYSIHEDTVRHIDIEHPPLLEVKYKICDNFESDIDSKVVEESTDVSSEIDILTMCKDTVRLSEEETLKLADEITDEASFIADMKDTGMPSEEEDLKLVDETDEASFIADMKDTVWMSTKENLNLAEDISDEASLIADMKELKNELLDLSADIGCHNKAKSRKEHLNTAVSAEHCVDYSDTLAHFDTNRMADAETDNEKCDIAQNIIASLIETTNQDTAFLKQSTVGVDANSVHPDETAPVGAVSSGCTLIAQECPGGATGETEVLTKDIAEMKNDVVDLTADTWSDGFGLGGLFSMRNESTDLTTACNDDFGLRSLFSEQKKKMEKSKSARKRKKQQQKLLKVLPAKQRSNQPASRFAQSSQELVFSRDEDVDTGLTCPVCLELFHQPRSCHPCGHIFCDPCLRRLTTLRGGWEEVPCPLCRTVIQTCELQQEFDHILRSTHPDIYAGRAAAERRSRFRHHKLPFTPPVPLGRRLIRHLRSARNLRQPDAGWMSHDWFKFLLGCTVGVCTSMLIMLLNRVKSINDVRAYTIMTKFIMTYWYCLTLVRSVFKRLKKYFFIKLSNNVTLDKV